MNIKPISSPAQVTQAPSKAAEYKAKAIAAFNGNGRLAVGEQPATQVVQNQSAVGVEELSAIKAPESDIKANTEQTSAAEETLTAEPKEETPQAEDPALARQFAQLARQERALQAKKMQQDNAIKAKEQELKAREDVLTAKDSQYKSGYISKDKLKENPLLVLSEAGVSYEEITQQAMGLNQMDPRLEAHINKLEAKIAQLEESNETGKKFQVEEQTKAYESAKKQIKNDVTKLVNKPNADFETIKATGSYDDVVDLIERTYKEDGILLGNEEAAQMVEDYLIEEAMKITQISKIKSRMQQAQDALTKKVEQKQTPPTETKPQQQQMKTLTNNASASRPLSARERAIAKFKGESIS